MQLAQTVLLLKQLHWFCFFISVLLISSCSGLKPLPATNEVQTLRTSETDKINGDYAIFSVDSSYRTLEYALTFSDRFDRKHPPGDNDFLKLVVVSPTRIKAILYKDGIAVKKRMLRGRLKQNYFWFSIKRFSTIAPLYGLLNTYQVQKGRIAILPGGDLKLDVSGGGALLLIFFPCSATGGELYQLVFKRLSPTH